MRGEFRERLVGDLSVVPANVSAPDLSVQSRSITDMSVRVEFRWSEEFKARVDAAAGFEPRASFVRRAVERALGPGAGLDRESGYAEAVKGANVAPVSPAPAEQPENRYVSVYPDHDENAELPPPAEQPTIAEQRDAWELERRRVSPSRPIAPRVPFRRDVKPFQRGGS